MTRVSWVGPVGAGGQPVSFGILCPTPLAEALRAHWQRNLDDHASPASIPEDSTLGIRPADAVHLDAPGMGMSNDELLRLELPGYPVTCYLLQAAGAVWLLDAARQRGPSYALDGVPVYELRCHHHGVILPTADLPAILDWLGQHAARSTAAYTAFAHRVASPHVHFEGLRPLPES